MERRQYFRINDTLGLSYRLVGEPSKKESFWSSLAETDEKINRLLSQVVPKEPLIGKLLGLMNQKLERIANQMILDGDLLQKMASRVGEVNISACGLGFSHGQPVAVNSRLALQLHLLPSDTVIHADGQVVGCQPQPEGDFYWRIAFSHLAEANRDTLIRHLIERQRQQIKATRAENGGL